MEGKKYYCLVQNSKIAQALHEALSKEGIKNTLAPTPRQADHCCGICILYYDGKDQGKIKEIAKKEDLPIDTFYEMENLDDPNRYKFC